MLASGSGAHSTGRDSISGLLAELYVAQGAASSKCSRPAGIGSVGRDRLIRLSTGREMKKYSKKENYVYIYAKSERKEQIFLTGWLTVNRRGI